MYHILTPFPDLLNYAFYAPIIIRIALGLTSIDFGVGRKQTKENQSSEPTNPEKKSSNYFIQGLFIIGGLAVIIGFYTQIAAILLAILYVLGLFKKDWICAKNVNRSELILLFAMCLFLLLFGAGAFAIDYPL